MARVGARSGAAAAQRANAIQTLAIDAASAEVVAAFAASGLRSVLLKGPAMARWLYDDPTERAYGDIDLLVDPSTFDQAEAVLRDVGFSRQIYPVAPHHTQWSRQGTPRITVELHRSLLFVRCPEARVWSALSREPAELEVAGTTVQIPRLQARLLVVALHAAVHGVGFDHAIADLHRALQRATVAEWDGAAALASELDVIEPFAAALRFDPLGADVANSLLLPPIRREFALQLLNAPPTGVGLERLFEANSTVDRLRLLARKFVPTREFMRNWQPLARRGAFGLVATYLWRPFWLVWKAPSGFRAWRRADALQRRLNRI
jgi:hypothetical protein